MNGSPITKTFSVAGHCFRISVPDSPGADAALLPYLPFEVQDGSAQPLFSLSAGTADVCGGNFGKLVGRFNNEAPYIWIHDRKDMLVFGFSISPDKADFMLCVTPDFREGHICLPQDCPEKLLQFALGNSSMLMYMLNTSTLDTLLIHASTVVYNGCGYAFTGRSGSGKSTHSRLWLKYMEGSWLLNDDNPVVRLTEDGPYIYGSPWSGKTPCWKNGSARLRAIVHIFQAPSNRIERLSGVRAYASFITSCSSMKWERKVSDGINSTVGKLIGECTFCNLYCLPDRQAALLCGSEVAGEGTSCGQEQPLQQ